MKRVCLVMLLIMMFTFVPALSDQARAAAPQPTLNVLFAASLSQHYTILGTVIQHVRLTISGYIMDSSATAITITFLFNYEGNTFLGNGSCPAPVCSIEELRPNPLGYQLTITLHPYYGAFNFNVTGYWQDTSFLFRDSAVLNYAEVTTNSSLLPIPNSYAISVPLTPQTQVFSTDPSEIQGVPVQQVTLGGREYLVADFPSSELILTGFNRIAFIVLYQPPYFDYFVAIFFVLVLLFFLVLLPRISRIGRRGAMERAKQVGRKLTWFDHRKLFAILALISVLMVCVALAFGPSPTPRVYVSATPPEITTLSPYITGAGYTYFTPSQAEDDFDTLSYLGSFRTVVIADVAYPVNSLGLSSSYNIIVLNGTEPTSYVNTLFAVYGSHVTLVDSPQDLENLLRSQALSYSSNNIGLGVSQGLYNSVVAFEGVLSLLLPFFALAFFSRYLIEYQGKVLSALLQALIYSFFIFMLGELVYIQTGILLGTPVALHSAISPVETAVGYLGFGGGSRPRLAMSALGFFFGVVVGKGGTTKFDRIGFLAFLTGFVFLLVDPLTVGQTLYGIASVALTSSTGGSVGSGAYNGLRGFVTGVMDLFGNYVTLGYYSQHGAVLYFAGATPFALYTYIRKSSATFLMLACGLISAVGYVRIGDQLPIKPIASVFPGAVVAVIVIIVFVGFDRIERFLRSRVNA